MQLLISYSLVENEQDMVSYHSPGCTWIGISHPGWGAACSLYSASGGSSWAMPDSLEKQYRLLPHA